MNKDDFKNLLKLASKDKSVISEFKDYILNVSVETCSVRDNINYYLDEDVANIWKCDIENMYAAYFDLDDEYNISDVLVDCENVNDNSNEILDCIDKGCFSFEDWGYNSDLDFGEENYILDYEYDVDNNDLVISVWFVSHLGFYIEDEANIKPLRINLNHLFTTNHSNVA